MTNRRSNKSKPARPERSLRSRRARPSKFSARVLAWYDRHGRHDLPWQHPRSAYRVWVSEIMLQQTQVVSVIPYFARFMRRFPNVKSLAAAPLDDVLQHWAGLGYYARARNLHRAAQLIVERHRGRFPRVFDAARALPGIGRSTAGAILAQAFGQEHAILDGNVKRLLSRYYAVRGWPGTPRVAERLWRHAEAQLPSARMADYTQALMDLGATVCARRPDCARCPLRADCAAYATGDPARYPQSRPRKLRPLREAQILILARADGGILLERRPARGIWGGLWSLPELPCGSDVQEHCQSVLGLEAGPARELALLRHGFTHFELDIRPWWTRVKLNRRALDESQRWYHAGEPAPALPTPIRKLINRVTEESLA